MGLGSYVATGNGAVSGVPDYLDVQVCARYPQSQLVTVNDANVSSGTGDGRFVKFDCEAPQYYGSNAINLEVIDGAWNITGGYGIWWVLTEDEYDSYTGTAPSVEGLLGNLLNRVEMVIGDPGEEYKKQDNKKSAIKFTTRQVRVTVNGYTAPDAGIQDFSSSGGIV